MEGYIVEAAKLAWYLYLLNTNDPLSRLWIPGTTYIPPSYIPIDATTFALVSPPVGGVIIYQIYDLKPLISTVIAYELARMRVEFAMRTQLAVITRF